MPHFLYNASLQPEDTGLINASCTTSTLLPWSCLPLYGRYFDAARSYGMAEEFLGSWLGGLGREQLDRAVVGSKWGYYYTADWQVRRTGTHVLVVNSDTVRCGTEQYSTALYCTVRYGRFSIGQQSSWAANTPQTSRWGGSWYYHGCNWAASTARRA